MDSSNKIIENINNPHELERIFRNEPESFKTSFADAWNQNPDSQVLAVWYERLNFNEEAETANVSSIKKDFMMMGILAILAGLTSRIIFQFVEQETIAPVNLAFGIIPFIAAYFLYNNTSGKRIMCIIGGLFILSGFYINMLPLKFTDSVILANLHLPIFLWVLLGFAYTGDKYRMGNKRLAYLKFNGEFAILYAIMAICGMILTALTMSLFTFVGMNISEFYFKNVVLFGAVALSIVAISIVSSNLKLSKNIAPYLAKIFSPLVLATLLVYLITVILVGKNPFVDRDFLMSFNGILIIVLGVTIFSITESGTSGKKNFFDYINFALISIALIIDSVALSAIIFRLSSYGITPNRLAVLGINILIWANLIWIMTSYVRFLREKTGITTIQNAVTKYLPIYGLWAALVTVIFPLIF